MNYWDAWTSAPFGRFFINSTTVTLLSVVGTLLSSSFVGYGFARFRFPGRGVLFLIVLSTLILPHHVTVIPRFLLYREFGWLDTLLPLWVPWFFGGSAFGIFLFRQFFLTIPNDLDQSARIDGAGFLTIFARILMPLSQSVTVSLAILTFLASWNELFWPIIVLNTYEKYTLALGAAVLPHPRYRRRRTSRAPADGRRHEDDLRRARSVCRPAALLHAGHRPVRPQGIADRASFGYLPDACSQVRGRNAFQLAEHLAERLRLPKA